MQKTKKIIAFLLMIILITSTIITVNTFSYAANTTIDALRQKYPQDSTWNGSFEFATECAGFARLMFYEYYGFSPNKLEKSYDLNSLKPGDILRYDGNGTGSVGHEVWVLGVNGDNITVVECNWGGPNRVNWDRVMKKSDIYNIQFIKSAPYAIGEATSPINAPNNIRATYGENGGIIISWDAVYSANAYQVVIYNAQDVENGDFSNRVKTYKVELDTSLEIKNLAKGEYYAYVHSIRGNEYSSTGGNGVKFNHIPLEGMYFEEEHIDLMIGDTYKLKLHFNPANTTDKKDLIWQAYSSLDEDVVTVDNEGNVVAKRKGTATILVRIKNSTTLYAQCSIRVKDTPIPITNLNLDKSYAELEVGDKLKLNATLLPENTTADKTLTWQSYNEDVAVVDQEGNVTAVGVGSTYIAVRSVASGYLTSCRLVVTEKIPKPLTSIAINIYHKTLEKGETYDLKVTYYPYNTTDNKDVTWTSSNPNVATIDSSGKVTAISDGETIITATCSGKTDTCKITVETEDLLKGDVNRDGKVALYDAFRILRQAIIGGDLLDDELYIMDYNDDGKVALYDAFRFLRQAILED